MKIKIKNKTKALFSLFLFIPLLFIGGCGCKEKAPIKIEEPLEIWGIWDDSDVIEGLLKDYARNNPQIKSIKYRKFTYEEYEAEVLKALAEGKGPDIFMVHHTWTNRYRDLMVSAEEALHIYQEALNKQSGCSKAPSVEDPILTKLQYSEAFVNVAYQDFVKNDQIYGIPLTVDTMALFYNEDLFNAVGISQQPKTWEEFSEYSQKITQKDAEGNILRAGAAIGSADNIYRPGDFLAMLMLQKGCPIIDGNDLTSKITYKKREERSQDMGYPALEAFKFYASFAKGSDPNYSWNPKMHHVVDSFVEGKVAMMVNYTYAIETIKAKAPQLNFKVATIPQFAETAPADEMTFPNYWGYVVARKANQRKNVPLEAWKILKYLGSSQQIKAYAKQTERPASRKDIIKEQSTDPGIGIFALQALKAKSFFQPNEIKIQTIFTEGIRKVSLGITDPDSALDEFNTKINVLLDEYERELKSKL